MALSIAQLCKNSSLELSSFATNFTPQKAEIVTK